MMRRLLPSLLAACALSWGVALAVGAVVPAPERDTSGRMPVVATTTQVADLVEHVGGDRVDVTRLLAPNADPHEHELRPGDVGAVGRARVIVRSGGDVDAWLGDALQSAGRRARLTTLIDAVHRDGEDPHWWQDPRNGVLAVEAIRASLTRADPAGAAGYARRARAYAARIGAVDHAIARCWAAVAPVRRRLVTSHDAYGYYARRYGLVVVGAVIPSLSARGQPSARGLARLVATIRRERVRSIFVERALNPAVERAVARESGARVGRPLQGDALGRGQTYLEALASDTRALVDGLTGGTGRCAVPPAPGTGRRPRRRGAA